MECEKEDEDGWQTMEEVQLEYQPVDEIESVDVDSMRESWNRQRGPHSFVQKRPFLWKREGTSWRRLWGSEDSRYACFGCFPCPAWWRRIL